MANLLNNFGLDFITDNEASEMNFVMNMAASGKVLEGYGNASYIRTNKSCWNLLLRYSIILLRKEAIPHV